MAVCITPGTLSPGHLVLFYVHATQGLQHSLSIRWKSGVDLTNITARRADASALAGAVARCMYSGLHITDWGIKNNFGNMEYQEAFSSAILGSHASASGAQDTRSATVALTGAGIPTAPGDCFGKATCRFHIGTAFLFVPGQQSILAGADSALDGLSNTLTTSPNFWADYYGQPCSVHPAYPVQYNAHVQRKHGT